MLQRDQCAHFFLQIRVRGLDELLDIDSQIAAHLGRKDRAERAQSQAGNVLVAVGQVTLKQQKRLSGSRNKGVGPFKSLGVLLETLSDQQVDVLALVKQKHGAQVADAFISEPARCDQFETFELKHT